jgi:hypothetical protein
MAHKWKDIRRTLSPEQEEETRRVVRDRLDELSGRVAQDYAGVPAEEGMSEIDAVVAATRAS